jgi:hypothetical protein
MKEFAFDSAGRLFVLSWTAAREWQHALEVAEHTPEGETLIDTWLYFDTRLDVFDLKRRVYLGTYQWRSDKVRLLVRGGETLAQLVERDSAGQRQIALYRIAVHTQPKR